MTAAFAPGGPARMTLRAALALAGLVALGLVLDLALEALVPPERLSALCVDALRGRLHRQTRIRGAGLGVWSGLWLEGVSISERPDFAAGTFLEARRISVRPRLASLLRGRLAADDVVLSGVRLHVLRRRDGDFNFSDLASTGTLAVEARAASLRRGEIVYIDPAASLSLLLTDVNARVDGLAPAGKTAAAADLRLRGAVAGKPVEALLSLRVKAELSGYEPRRCAGRLTLSKVRHPNFRAESLRAEWDLSSPARAAGIREAEPGARGFTPFLRSVSGVLRLSGSPGELHDPAALGRESRWAGLLLYPVGILARARGLELPDLDRIPYSELRGDYAFQAGSVNIAPLYIRGPLLSFNAEGVVGLRRGIVGLKANLTMGKTAVGVLVNGPLGDPSVEPDVNFMGARGRSFTIEQRMR